MLAVPSDRGCARSFHQGPFVPATQQLKKAWLPKGVGRALVLRIMNLSHNASGIATVAFTPFVASRWGWRAVPLILGAATGAFAVIWQLLGADAPPDAATPTPATPPPKATDADKPAAPTIEWRIFRLPQVLAPMQAFFGAGFTTFCFNLWGPTYYQEVLGCTPTVAGAYLAWQTPVAFVGDWLVVGAEELLRGIPAPAYITTTYTLPLFPSLPLVLHSRDTITTTTATLPFPSCLQQPPPLLTASVVRARRSVRRGAAEDPPRLHGLRGHPGLRLHRRLWPGPGAADSDAVLLRHDRIPLPPPQCAATATAGTVSRERLILESCLWSLLICSRYRCCNGRWLQSKLVGSWRRGHRHAQRPGQHVQVNARRHRPSTRPAPPPLRR